MNWKSRIRQYDQSALQDLTNAGLLRRAGKLCAAGKVKLVSQHQDGGEFSVGDNTVHLFADFPQRVKCDCKTAGICVHTLAAILDIQQSVLDDNQPSSFDQPVSSPQQELLAISQQEIFKWAGKTARVQAEKILLANEGKKPQYLDNDKSVEIGFDNEIRCRYVASGGLAGIICSAPDNRRKGVVAACLLGWRRALGEEISWPDQAAPKTSRLTPSDKQLLREIKSQLDYLLRAGLMHSTVQQIQSLRTLAWSAKGESFPQVCAAILHLAGAVVEYQDRSAKVDTQYLLDVISRLWFQCERLLAATGTQLTALKGQARRTYKAKDTGKLWVLGASQYSTLSGAKGVSLVAWDISHNKPYRINIGRTAESAHSLDINSVWGIPLPWEKGCSLQRLAGQVITLSNAKVSMDSRISLSKDTLLENVEQPDQYASQLHRLGFMRWPELISAFEYCIAELAPQFESVLVRPDSVYEFEINEYEQQWIGWAKDAHGEIIKMTLPVGDINNDRVKRINHIVTKFRNKIWGMVLEPQFDGIELKLLPASIILRDNNTWLCFSPDFEFFRRRKVTELLSGWINKIAVHHRLNTNKLRNLETPAIDKLIHYVDDFIFGAAELGLDCKLTNQERSGEISSELKTANALCLDNVFEQMCQDLTTDRLLMAYQAFSLANRRLNLQRMRQHVKH